MRDAPRKNRLDELYRRKLVRSESATKELPLERILQKEVVYHPSRPEPFQCDILEIGPGRGDFLFHLCEQHPDKRIMGIEIGRKRFEKLKERLDHHGFQNLTLVFADARTPLIKDFPSKIVQNIFVLFPDPWPRNCHRHKRLLQVEFLKVVCDRIKSGGEFTLGTDVQDYADWVMNNLKQIPDMVNLAGEGAYSEKRPDLITTFFEQKWKERGRGTWYLRFVKA